jgi:hypothetical protein
MQIRSGIVYNSFKYAMYALLLINTFYFFEINSAAEQATFKSGVSLSDFIVAYADAIDSLAWVALLLLFEIETSYDPPERHRIWVQPLIAGATLLCWAVIVYSFYGYYGGLDMLPGFSVYAGPDACALIGTDAHFAVSLDEYVPLDAANCVEIAAGAQYSADLNMFAPHDNFSMIKRLLWTDVVNAGAWIVVAGIIELEIILRIAGRATPQFLRIANIVKAPFWVVLAVAVVYWWMLDAPLDAWDAFLWIAAFFFIELNMIAKHEERARRRAEQKSA